MHISVLYDMRVMHACHACVHTSARAVHGGSRCPHFHVAVVCKQKISYSKQHHGGGIHTHLNGRKLANLSYARIL